MTMNEKHGAAEWLRGIIEEYEASGSMRCSAMAKMFGIVCEHERTCRDCITKMMTDIADRIDLEMMELPKDADGEPIRIGDVLYSSGNECRVVSITVKADEACVGVHTDEGTFLPSVNPKYLSRKKPEPADSWEKLEEDVNLGCRDYCEKHRLEECDYNMRVHMLDRAKKLAGIEDGGSK